MPAPAPAAAPAPPGPAVPDLFCWLWRDRIGLAATLMACRFSADRSSSSAFERTSPPLLGPFALAACAALPPPWMRAGALPELVNGWLELNLRSCAGWGRTATFGLGFMRSWPPRLAPMGVRRPRDAMVCTGCCLLLHQPTALSLSLSLRKQQSPTLCSPNYTIIQATEARV